MDAFGERIENLIKQLGITKTKFAEKNSSARHLHQARCKSVLSKLGI